MRLESRLPDNNIKRQVSQFRLQLYNSQPLDMVSSNSSAADYDRAQ
jgi:hypothetical protein